VEIHLIYQIEIENFYSVRQKQVIDLRAGQKVPDEQGRLVPIFPGSAERAPRVVAIYGANASGKSNVLRAIAFISWFVQHSFQHRAQAILPYQKFMTQSAFVDPTHLKISFAGSEDPTDEGSTKTCPYTYSVEMSGRDAENRERILSESLHYKPSGSSRMVRIFERDFAGNVKAADWLGLGKERAVLESILRPNSSIISTLGQLNNRFALQLIQAASMIETNILITRFTADEHDLLTNYATDEDLLDSLNRDIRRVDLGIDAMSIIAENGAPVATFSHAGLDAPVRMMFESHGTQEFVRIYPTIYRALRNGGIAVLDEMDTAIHPTLLPEILRWFSDPDRNPYGAQLFMSCHAVSLLSDLLKEEVLFCDKDSSGSTRIYSLTDIRGIRRDENFMANYLGGVYGGVPVVG